MSRLTIEEIITNHSVCCPVCHGQLSLEIAGEEKSILCQHCSVSYGLFENTPLLLSNHNVSNNNLKQEIQRFWGSLYTATYSSFDTLMSKEKLQALMEKLQKLFQHRRHLAVVEMPVNEMKGKKVLEIGCGAGAHSAFFSWLGAEMFSMDITLERVVATAKKLDLLNTSQNICLQADAEQLPFPDDFFDVVYSNGVLHHTLETGRTIEEVFRVLKPRGKAAIMLYAKNSFYYWVYLFFFKGIISGNIFKSRNWLGKVTEWMSQEPQEFYNPETKVFTKSEISKLFSRFKTVKIRKNSFAIQQIPLIGNLISKMLTRKTGLNEAGILLYGHPWRNETSFELRLGRFIGFGLNIEAVK